MPSRRFALLLAVFVMVFACLGTALRLGLGGSSRLEGILCRRLLLCWDDLVRDEAFRQLWLGEEEDVRAAISGFEELVRRNPASPFRWCDLAEALLETGATERARPCIARAVELGPRLAPVLVRAGNFHFRLGETERALRYHAQVLGLTGDYDALIFGTYSRMSAGIDAVLTDGIPPHRRAAEAYLRHLMREKKLSEADRTWGWMARHSLCDSRTGSEYAGLLLGEGAYLAAAQAWASTNTAADPSYRRTNFVFNGDFELEPTGPLDWRITPFDGAEAARDSTVAYSGRSSLRIHFDGTANVPFNHVSQRVIVDPGTYRFAAEVRTEGITTDQGLEFWVFDAKSSNRLMIRTEGLIGTIPWTKVEKQFTVPSATRLLEVTMARRASEKFDNKINGTAWVDAVVIAPVRSADALLGRR